MWWQLLWTLQNSFVVLSSATSYTLYLDDGWQIVWLLLLSSSGRLFILLLLLIIVFLFLCIDAFFLSPIENLGFQILSSKSIHFPVPIQRFQRRRRPNFVLLLLLLLLLFVPLYSSFSFVAILVYRTIRINTSCAPSHVNDKFIVSNVERTSTSNWNSLLLLFRFLWVFCRCS